MVEQTLQIIEEIETKAEEIVKKAEQTAILCLKRTHEKHSQEMKKAEKAVNKEKETLIQAAEISAQNEAKQIEAQTQKVIEVLKQKAQPKIDLAKKEILRCLS